LESLTEPKKTLFVAVEIPLFVIDALISWVQKHLVHTKGEVDFVPPHLWAIPFISIGTDKSKAFEASSFALGKVSKLMKPLDFDVFVPRQKDSMLVAPVCARHPDSFVETTTIAMRLLEDMGFEVQQIEPSICMGSSSKALESPLEPLISFVGSHLWLACTVHEALPSFKMLRHFSLPGA